MQNTIEQSQLDFAAPMPSPAPQDAPGEADSSLVVGSVFLKGAQYCGQPGRLRCGGLILTTSGTTPAIL